MTARIWEKQRADDICRWRASVTLLYVAIANDRLGVSLTPTSPTLKLVPDTKSCKCDLSLSKAHSANSSW